MDVDHDDELPKKKKPKRQEKPVPAFLQDLDILNLHECEITSQQISVKGEDGSEELLAVATRVGKDGFIVHLEKDLSAHQHYEKLSARSALAKQILRRHNANTTYSKPAKKWGQFHSMTIQTLRHSVESSMLSSTMILLMGFFHTMMEDPKPYKRQEMAPSSNASRSASPTQSMVGKALHRKH